MSLAIDTPARIAILGAGPIGLEAALYARFLGYDVDLFEQGSVAENVRRWGHVRMFTPFGVNRSTLGLSALNAQDPNYAPPSDDQHLTGLEWVARYLEPLAATDLLADSLRQHSTVVAVGRPYQLKHEGDWESRREEPFRILVRNAHDQESVHQADAVIDATGVYGHPNWLGAGGLPAIGELVNASRIEYGLPDILGRDRDQYQGRRTLVVGCGLSAAMTMFALSRLTNESPSTHVVWVTSNEPSIDPPNPVRRVADDPWPQRDILARDANQLAHSASPSVQHRGGCWVDSIEWQVDNAEFRVRLVRRPTEGVDGSDDSAETGGEVIEVDRIVALMGHRPDVRLWSELRVELSGEHDVPRTESEPDFYVLGAKSVGRRSDFVVPDGLDQIRNLFAILGDRPTLDLYAKR